MVKKTQLPFDMYSRHYIVTNIVNKVFRKSGEKLSILDLGGYAGETQHFFVDDIVTVLDVYDIKDQKNYLMGDATNLKFQNNSFDIVTNFDVFEHIPVEARKSFIKEALRVSKRAVIMTFPVDVDSKYAVSEADKLLDSFYKTLTGKRHPWLREHIDNAIPTSGEFERLLDSIGVDYAKISSNDLYTWEMMQVVNFLGSVDPLALKKAKTLNEQYNSHIESIEYNVKDGYRSIYILFKDNKYKLVAEQNLKHLHKIPSEVEFFKGDEFQRQLFTEMIQLIAEITRHYKGSILKKDKLLQEQTARIINLEEQLKVLKMSASWRVTAPLRKAKRAVKKISGKNNNGEKN